MASRAALNSQLTAVGRTGRPRRLRCSLIAEDAEVPCELVIGRVGIKGAGDDSGPPVRVRTVQEPLPARTAACCLAPTICPGSVPLGHVSLGCSD